MHPQVLTAERGTPPVSRQATSVGALAGELRQGVALAGALLWTLAAVLHTGLHVQLHWHPGLAVLKGLCGQQPLTLSLLEGGKDMGVGGCSHPRLLLHTQNLQQRPAESLREASPGNTGGPAP